METTEALVINTIKYGDSSLIAHCFTERYGKQTYMLKGILSSSRKGLLQKSYFQPLSLLEFETAPQPTDRLGYIKEARLTYGFTNLPFVIQKSTLALFLSEVLLQVLQEEAQANTSLFAFLKQSIITLDKIDYIGVFHLLFLFQLSNYIGFYPLIEDRKHPYFDLKNGCSTTIIPHYDFLEGALKNLWFTLCGMKFDTQLVEPINKTHKKRLLEQLLFYYQLHLQNFKMPKSITILHELFK